MQTAFNREWKKNKNMGLHFFYTIAWNIFSWAGIIQYNGPFQVAGAKYHSMSEAVVAEPFTLAIFLFPLVGLVMLYSCVAHWINRTEFKLDGEFFKSQKGPLPWPGKKLCIPTKEIKQAYVQEYFTTSDNEHSTRYRVMLQQHTANEIIVDADICDYTDALALEQWLEKKLGIENKSVPGEVEFKKVS